MKKPYIHTSKLKTVFNKQVGLIAVTMVLASTAVMLHQVYAQDPVVEIRTEFHHYALSLVIFVAAGIVYSASGFIKQLRRTLAGDGTKFEWRKGARATILGIGLGIGALISTIIAGDPIATTNLNEAGSLWAIATTAILYLDKWVLGRADIKSVRPAA